MTDLGALIPQLQTFAKNLVDLAGRAGVQPRVTSTLRTDSEQRRLYAAFQRGQTHYPVAPPGRSAHQYGFAFDLTADTQQNLHDLGQIWRSWGGVWSADDEVHFEYPGFVAPAETPAETPSLWDYVGTALSFTSLFSTLLELGYVVFSREEAERIARQLHVDPYGRIF